MEAWLLQLNAFRLSCNTAQQIVVEQLKLLGNIPFDCRPTALIIHQRMTANTELFRSLPDSQPGTQPHDSQPLTVGQFASCFSAQQGIPRLLPTNDPHRTAPECDISHIHNCFRRCAIANPIKIVELYKNMNNNVENRYFNRSNATRSQCLCIKQEKYP